MIFEAETALINAVHRTLLEQLQISEAQIDIEVDDVAPGMAGKTFYCISPYGAQPGKHSASGDQIQNYVFGIRVAVIERIGNLPRDRRGSHFITYNSGINAQLSRVSKAIHYSHGVRRYANEELEGNEAGGTFQTPLKVQSADQRPTLRQAEVYGGKAMGQGDPIVCMVRGINFGGAEYYGRTA